MIENRHKMGYCDIVYNNLHKAYPVKRTALQFRNAWQMLVATILSAQCTDKRVNIITSQLFEKYPVLDNYISMKKEELIKYIRSAGFYNNKSENILNAAKRIKENFDGKVPKTIRELTSIPGVARKTANVVLNNAYNITEGIAVDTHVKRLSFRLGLSKHKDPVKIEKDLMKLYSKSKWKYITYILIEHGRAVCSASGPACNKCILNKICPKNGL